MVRSSMSPLLRLALAGDIEPNPGPGPSGESSPWLGLYSEFEMSPLRWRWQLIPLSNEYAENGPCDMFQHRPRVRVGLTAKCVRCQVSLTFRSLVPLTLHRCKPADLSRPPPDISYLWEDPRSEPSARDGWMDFDSDYDFPHPDADYLSPVGQDWPSSSAGSLMPTWEHEHEHLEHERAMAHLEAFLWCPPLPDEDHEVEPPRVAANLWRC